MVRYSLSETSAGADVNEHTKRDTVYSSRKIGQHQEVQVSSWNVICLEIDTTNKWLAEGVVTLYA